ncbi:c-type cytochrome [Dyadobacter psychrotolerans]|uniref:C-type cytochrome n=1 Tax=Dyadobacter psychrotolerans TaxID=2541721 RepID=A0A4R5D6Q2_9BACT|nr:c-type cytochrome [Dyadobacter psychrotolerans]TDE09192.1 c-type cytochrome [Dyadobacter psychrotolerans]
MKNIEPSSWRLLLRLLIFLIVLVSGLLVAIVFSVIFPELYADKFQALQVKAGWPMKKQDQKPANRSNPRVSSSILPVDSLQDELILYGKDLIANTSKYLGPKGSVRQISNGMNCQNCHLEAGTKIMGNNYLAVYSTYPKFRARSAGTETIIKRISDCFERSLNGRKPDSASKEMKAMVSYMKWVGKDVQKGKTPEGSGLNKLAYLDRAADPKTGRILYKEKCAVCHGAKGEGIMQPDQKSFVYPPLWGSRSYNDGAGLYRNSSFAGFVKDNMPFGANYQNQILTDEQAWDLAAFVNSQPRPHKDQALDWKNISQKPIDFPFGPYSDAYTENQHKYGPFKPIAATRINK